MRIRGLCVSGVRFTAERAIPRFKCTQYSVVGMANSMEEFLNAF